MYTYKATYRSNYDGDTIRFDIDLGFNIIFRNQVIRVLGVNTPELRGEEKEYGKEIRDVVKAHLEGAEEIIVKTHKDSKGKYGRWLAEIEFDGVNLNQILKDMGFAHDY